MLDNKVLPLPKGWEILVWDEKTLEELWEKLKKDAWFFEDFPGEPKIVMKQFLNISSIPILSEEGFFYFSNIVPGEKAVMKFIFWDGTITGKEDLIKEMILWIFLTFKINRLEYYVLPFKKGEMRILEQKLGFSYEGTLRDVFRKKGRRFSLKIFSLLKKELIKEG